MPGQRCPVGTWEYIVLRFDSSFELTGTENTQSRIIEFYRSSLSALAYHRNGPLFEITVLVNSKGESNLRIMYSYVLTGHR